MSALRIIFANEFPLGNDSFHDTMPRLPENLSYRSRLLAQDHTAPGHRLEDDFSGAALALGPIAAGMPGAVAGKVIVSIVQRKGACFQGGGLANVMDWGAQGDKSDQLPCCFWLGRG